MADEEAFESHPMSGGDGPDSYAKNSSVQRSIIDASQELLNKAIVERLEIRKLPPSKTFRIADLGCSTGPNTFQAVEIILEAVKLKYEKEGLNSHIPEFQVFFQDHISNDFNSLFRSLPQNKGYYAAGVPGSFHKQMFPNASITIAHSSTAIHWLSKVPTSVTNSNSPAWNKGRIHYLNSRDEVLRAYETQYNEDMYNFMKARANEVVSGGMVVLTFSGRHNDASHSTVSVNVLFQILGSSLMDLVGKGVITEEKVDSFNIPIYPMSPKELSVVIERNGCFSIEMVAELPVPRTENTSSIPKIATNHIRGGGIIQQHFGEEISDELFPMYEKKLEENISSIVACKSANFFVVLKRKES